MAILKSDAHSRVNLMACTIYKMYKYNAFEIGTYIIQMNTKAFEVYVIWKCGNLIILRYGVIMMTGKPVDFVCPKIRMQLICKTVLCS